MKKVILVLAISLLTPCLAGAIGVDYQSNAACTNLANCTATPDWGVLWFNAPIDDFIDLRDGISRGVTCDENLVALGICVDADGLPLDNAEAKAYTLEKLRQYLQAVIRNERRMDYQEANEFVDPGDGVGGEPE